MLELNDLAISSGWAKPSVPTAKDPWQVLETFLQDLQRSDRTNRPFRLLLKTICEGLRADAVYLTSRVAGETVEIVGPQNISPTWCLKFTDQILNDAFAGSVHLIRSDLANSANFPPPIPSSVAMIKVSRSQNVWVVALSFNPERLFNNSDIQLMKFARRLLINHSQQLQAADRFKEAMLGVIHCTTTSIDARDPCTSGHSERVARIAVRLAQQMRFPDAGISDLYLAGLLHDVGNIGIRDCVLQKPATLTRQEMLHIQEHVIIGDRMISSVKHLAHLRVGIRNHHERYDGSGYPDQLAGDQIPFTARILAVAEACDAMLSPRPYRPALPVNQVESILKEGASSQWDPEIVEHFMACRHDLFSLCQQAMSLSIRVAPEHAGPGTEAPSATTLPVI